MAQPSRRQLILGHQSAVAAVRGRLDDYAALAWRGLPSYRDADIDRLVSRLVPVVLAGQRQIAGLTDAYIAAALGRRGSGVDRALVTGAAVRGGAVPDEVYRRPAKTVYWALSRGVPLDKAVASGGSRLQAIVRTDMQLAKREQSRLSLTDGGVDRYRRVLTGAENCALCADASGNLYNTGDLMPIHAGCDCDVEPDTTGSAAAALNDDRGSGEAVDADRRGDQTPVVHDHGEYGPTLAWSGDKFTGPDDL